METKHPFYTALIIVLMSFLATSVLLAQDLIDVSSKGTASASSELTTIWEDASASSAFDDDTDTYWKSEQGWDQSFFWLQMDFGAGSNYIIYKYTFTSTYQVNFMPVDWQFQARNEGQNWQVLHDVTGASILPETKHEYSLADSTAYRYYRIYITKTNLSNYGAIFSEVELLSTPAPEPKSAIVAKTWNDQNANGIRDNNESALKDVVVMLHMGADSSVYAKHKTNAAGQAKFDLLSAGDYSVIVDESTLPAGGICTTGNLTRAVTIGEIPETVEAKFGFFYSDTTVVDKYETKIDLPWSRPLLFVDGSPSLSKEPWSNAVDGVLQGWGGTATVKGDENGDVWAIFKVDGGPCQFDRLTIITDNGHDDNSYEWRQMSKVQILTSVAGSDPADFSPVTEFILDNDDNVYQFKTTQVAAYVKIIALSPAFSAQTWRQLVEIALGELELPALLKHSAEQEQTVEMPTEYSLGQNYPNPFNPTTSISYTLPEAQNVDIAVYNIKGDLVKQLASGYQDAGVYNISWNATNAVGAKVTTGVYFYRITAGSFTETKKMTLMQ